MFFVCSSISSNFFPIASKFKKDDATQVFFGGFNVVYD
jgi:hypothetical protein